ncbi:MAG: FAD-binding protein [Desulfoferrobacter sp.]
MLKQKGVEIRTRSFLARLHTDSQGAVRGVRIRSDYKFPDGSSGVVRDIYANRAVILATGGFCNDVQFRMTQNPVLDESVGSTNHRGATAEGLIAALELKAAPVHLSWIQLGPWGCADEKGYGCGASFACYSVYPAGILVDPATGERIANECNAKAQVIGLNNRHLLIPGSYFRRGVLDSLSISMMRNFANEIKTRC